MVPLSSYIWSFQAVSCPKCVCATDLQPLLPFVYYNDCKQRHIHYGFIFKLCLLTCFCEGRQQTKKDSSTVGKQRFHQESSFRRQGEIRLCSLYVSKDFVNIWAFNTIRPLVLLSFPAHQWSSPCCWAPCDRADSICSRCESNDALMPYVKSHHLLSLLTFPLKAPSNGVTSHRHLTCQGAAKCLLNKSPFVEKRFHMWQHFSFHGPVFFVI